MNTNDEVRLLTDVELMEIRREYAYSNSSIDDVGNLLGHILALEERCSALAGDAKRYSRIRAARNMVGMLEFATAHADTDAEYDAAIDRLPVCS